MIIHVIGRGDSVYDLARRYGVPAETIMTANQITDPGRLVIGQALVIPGDFTEHTVRGGESMYSIANSYGVSLSALIDANPQITNPSRLQVGQTVIVPVAPRKLGTIYVNGYAFPGVAQDVLDSVLPHLSYLSVFSYMARADGSLAPIDDANAIGRARAAGVAPVMSVTNMEEGEGFSTELARTILNDVGIQETLIQNIISTLREKNYYALNVDFEYIDPRDRQNYSNFISRVTNALRPLGYGVSVAVAPKTGPNQEGLLYEAHDYAALGALADQIIIMTYEWGYMYGPPMAVAPVDQVRKVLDYAVSVIPTEKILMGMPNYGYDWTLPFVRGSAARVLTNPGAVRLASQVGAQIQYDATAQAPYFNYYASDGRRHEVWFDDPRSIRARLLLVDEYGLGGVSYWTVNNYHAANWVVLDSMYNVRKVI